MIWQIPGEFSTVTGSPDYFKVMFQNIYVQ